MMEEIVDSNDLEEVLELPAEDGTVNALIIAETANTATGKRPCIPFLTDEKTIPLKAEIIPIKSEVIKISPHLESLAWIFTIPFCLFNNSFQVLNSINLAQILSICY